MKNTLIMAIESSCDETAIAIVENGERVLANIVSSQIDIHTKFGGVVPEIASRKHLESINNLIREALETAEITNSDLTHIAVTYTPGLIGALLVGVSTAKAYSYALDLPLIPVNHMEGHVYANFLSHGDKLSFPLICLIVSGGHTMIVKMTDHGKYEVLGNTRDDAVGEAFDKVARAMGIGYPGGPIIDRISKSGNEDAIEFPKAKLEKGSLDFSYSGIKSAVLNYLNKQRMKNEEINVEDVAASFQKAATDILVEKSLEAAEREKISTIILAGGVSANSRLRAELTERGKRKNVDVLYPEMKYCTDNAAMIGAVAHHQAQRKEFADLDLNARANFNFSQYIKESRS